MSKKNDLFKRFKHLSTRFLKSKNTIILLLACTLFLLTVIIIYVNRRACIEVSTSTCSKTCLESIPIQQEKQSSNSIFSEKSDKIKLNGREYEVCSEEYIINSRSQDNLDFTIDEMMDENDVVAPYYLDVNCVHKISTINYEDYVRVGKNYGTDFFYVNSKRHKGYSEFIGYEYDYKSDKSKQLFTIKSKDNDFKGNQFCFTNVGVYNVFRAGGYLLIDLGGGECGCSGNRNECANFTKAYKRFREVTAYGLWKYDFGSKKVSLISKKY